MNENILAWNTTNWVTVGIMALIWFFLLGIVLKWVSSKRTVTAVNTTQNAPVATGTGGY